MFGNALKLAFLIRVHHILKHGPDPELIRTAEKYVASISYTAQQNYRLVGKQIRPAPPARHNLKGVVHRHFLLYRKHIDDIDAADVSKSEKRDLTKWRTGQHGESGLGYRLTTLTRTEGDTAQAAASVDAYKEAGIERYRYNAMLDDKTCKVCRELNGKIFKISEKQPGVNFPPIHNSCRCYTEPIL